ncbi:hypothetical protein SLS53_006645 [Cytospora paraplurivora]|uniref:Major facilitator superfamily (MFS) profile domain-containing protein n=1 Tax=Cytospora paraplurivora TaxID=2898453 RepID=A0AAN9UAS3_9PEZI
MEFNKRIQAHASSETTSNLDEKTTTLEQRQQQGRRQQQHQHDSTSTDLEARKEKGNIDALTNTSPAQERSIRGFRWSLVCVAIFSANLLYGLDTTISADIQGAVSEHFDNVEQIGWLGIGFMLGSGVAILPLGKAFGIFNTKWLYVGCLLNFSAASALCGGAPNMKALIIGRVWAGVGGAGMYLGTLNLVMATSTQREASLYVGVIAFVYGAGCILGPVIGGALADSSATWRWAFYINLVVFGALSPIYIFALPSVPMQADRRWADKVKELDWLGMVLSAGMYVCFVLAFTFGGAEWGWSSGRVIALIVVSGVLAAAFAASQVWAPLLADRRSQRLFPVDFLGNLQLLLQYLCMATSSAALFVAIYYIPLYFLFVHGNSGIEAAVHLLPFMVIYVTATLSCGYLLPRVGYHWAWYLASGVLLVCGGAAMTTVGVDTSPAHVYGFSVLLGFGQTMTQASYGVSMALVEAARIPESIQFINAAQGQSMLISLVIASAVFQNVALNGMEKALAGLGYTATQIQGAIAGADSSLLQELSPANERKAIEAIMNAIGKEWILIIVAGALQIVSSLLMSKKKH